MRGCEAGELELVGDRLCLGLRLGVGWEGVQGVENLGDGETQRMCGECACPCCVCVECVGTDGALCYPSERVNTLVRGGHCETGWGGGWGSCALACQGHGHPLEAGNLGI